MIDDDHPLDEWAKARHFPPEFLAIAWEVFEEKYLHSFGKCYAYERWPQRFFEAVKGNQYGLWRINSTTQEYFLSQKGLETMMAIDIKKNREQSKAFIHEKDVSTSPPIINNQPGDFDNGAWFMAELKRRCGDEFDSLFSPQPFINNAHTH